MDVVGLDQRHRGPSWTATSLTKKLFLWNIVFFTLNKTNCQTVDIVNPMFTHLNPFRKLAVFSPYPLGFNVRLLLAFCLPGIMPNGLYVAWHYFLFSGNEIQFRTKSECHSGVQQQSTDVCQEAQDQK